MGNDYKRARVALTLPTVDVMRNRARATHFTHSDWCIHLGHVRTLLLGSLVAKEYGIPYHIRMDDPRTDCIPGAGITVDDYPHSNSGAVADLMSCCSSLNIDVDDVYYPYETPPSLRELKEEIGDRAEFFHYAINHNPYGTPWYRAKICDDIFRFAPSLMIKGTEFGMGKYVRSWHHAATKKDSPERHTEREVKLFEIAGRERHQFTTPLITYDTYKMGKTEYNAIHWECLKAIPPEVAIKFLLATSTHPENPLEHLDDEFDIDDIVLTPYEWSWEIFGDLVRNH